MSRRISPNDRLGFTCLLAGIVNTIAVLGISFAPSDRPPNLASSLDVILVQTTSQTRPKDADFLAQANQQGGGDSEERARPSDIFSGPVPKPEIGIAPMPVDAGAPVPTPAQPDPKALTVRQSTHVVATTTQTTDQPARPLPESAELIERRLEMASLQSQIDEAKRAIARRPRRKFLTANAQADDYAPYMAAWVAKVERVGNINFPDEVRTRGLQGSLILTVSIRRDGSLEKVVLIQSSGEPTLDDAARRTVEMAAPYASLPVVKDDPVDVVDITRTWQYLSGSVDVLEDR